ncbi:MAG: DUF2939 domain-containing protein [Deinococcus sp.]|nr:DUF2939 domain-containing protein [Deinococcus sp.]
MKLRTSSLLIIATLLLAAWFLAQPYIIVSQMSRAAKAGDTNALSPHVDYPALRESIKSALTAAIEKQASSQPGNDLAASLSTAFTKMIVGPAVEALVTPELVAAMLRGQKPLGKSSSKDSDTKFSMGYESLNRFVVHARNKTSPQDDLQLVFTRSGLSWKLSAVR